MRTKAALVVGTAAVAVELNVRQMGAPAFEGRHCLARRGPVARKTEVVAVNMHWVRQAQIRRSLRKGGNYLPRRDVEHVNGAIQSADVSASLLPDFYAAGVNELHAVTLRRRQQPGGIGPQLFRLVGGDLPHGVVVIAEENEEALVYDRRVVELLVRVACAERGNGGVERRRVAH